MIAVLHKFISCISLSKLECGLRARSSHPASVPVLTNALLTEWAQIPTDTLQNLVESLAGRVKAAIAIKMGNSTLMPFIFGIGCPTSSDNGIMVKWSHTFGHIVYMSVLALGLTRLIVLPDKVVEVSKTF